MIGSVTNVQPAQPDNSQSREQKQRSRPPAPRPEKSKDSVQLSEAAQEALSEEGDHDR